MMLPKTFFADASLVIPIWIPSESAFLFLGLWQRNTWHKCCTLLLFDVNEVEPDLWCVCCVLLTHTLVVATRVFKSPQTTDIYGPVTQVCLALTFLICNVFQLEEIYEGNRHFLFSVGQMKSLLFRAKTILK